MTWAMWFDCLRVGEFTVHASYIAFLLFKTENNNFIKEIKHVVRASIACRKPQQSLWEFSSSWKFSTASRVFTDLLSNSPKRSPRFSAGYEGTENMFYFFYKIIIQFRLKDKYNIRIEVRIYSYFQSLTKQNARTIQSML